ncbi:MAG TPA: ATP-binding protein [Candidatus Limnocylindrales bacterium]|nr:ATP-binding protein [Candidatus Limnocylindrales bacterium]
MTGERPLEEPSQALAAQRRARQAEIEPLVLPDMRERLRQGIFFIAAALAIYTFAVMVTFEEREALRFELNAGRVLGLAACWWALRVPRSRRFVLGTGMVAAVLVVGVALALSRLRNDSVVLPVLTVATVPFAATLVPWGARAQALFASVWVLGCLANGALSYGNLGAWAFSPLNLTVYNVCGLSVYVAAVYERSRRAMAARLDDARRSDEELEALHRELERRVRDRTAELELANRELEGFSYTVSHDLRSPLRAIHGFAHLLSEELSDTAPESAREHLAKIQRATNRMDGLIDDMLTLARVGRSEVRYDTVDVAELARSVVEELQTEQPDRRVEVRIGDIPLVRGDRAFIRLVMDNLLRNAWKFTRSREVARIEVSGEARGDVVECTVADNGVGFDMEFVGKLFKPFERLHADDYDGTGVGLATVARIVQRHGGTVSAMSAPGGGARFSFTLPRPAPQTSLVHGA